MSDKSEKLLERFQQEAVQSLANHVVEQKLLAGQSPADILKSLTDESETQTFTKKIEKSTDPLLLEDQS